MSINLGPLVRRCIFWACCAPAFGTGAAYIGDFDGDGRNEVLVRNEGWHIHAMDGRAVTSSRQTEVLAFPRAAAWQVEGIGDLNGDGRDEVLFRHADGEWHYFAMDGRHVIPDESGSANLSADVAWQTAGIGDFDGNGTDDVLLRHTDGRWFFYPMNGRRHATGQGAADLPTDLEWRFAGIGDLNGDGKDDVLLRHTNGTWSYQAMDGRRPDATESGVAQLTRRTAWNFAGIGDFDGDGRDDVLLRNADGRWFYYAMNGRRVGAGGRGQVPMTRRLDWRLEVIGDLNGDGRDDVLLRRSDGRWHYYAMNGRRPVRSASGPVRDLPRRNLAISCGAVVADEAPSYIGHVAGLMSAPEQVEAVLTGTGELHVVEPDGTGCFAFNDVPPGRYAVKVTAPGHRSAPARSVRLPYRDSYDDEPHNVTVLDTGVFTYHWEEDQTTAGAEYSSHVVEPRVVELDEGASVEVADAAAAARLRQRYNAVLVGDGWSQEHAHRLQQAMSAVPQQVQDLDNGLWLPASVWRLTDEFIDNDIAIVDDAGTRKVTVSSAAFVNATPRVATVDGKRGVWFSRRLHRAAVHFVTDGGRDEQAYERIFDERYGLTTRVEDYPALTAPTGHEAATNFQAFAPTEILALISMLEEMPSGMHKLDGMRYLLRRTDGFVHPVHPDAPAVGWPDSEYVEFMESAFKARSENYMHRLVVHEKAHFLWAHLFDDQLKAAWIALGGWYEDPAAESGWLTTKPTEFESEYGHGGDPDEDLAESISFFVVNPDRLRTRSLAKYEFVRDRIMQGDFYVAVIREDLTFEVYNLFPDYVYPGKIRQVDVTVSGEPHEEKSVVIDIGLHPLDSKAVANSNASRPGSGQEAPTSGEGPTAAQMRLYSESGSFVDVYMNPVDEHGEVLEQGQTSTLLRTEFTLNKHFKAGDWVPNRITLYDAAGHERSPPASDFGWRMHVDNQHEDETPPEYVASSLTMATSVSPEDQTVQVIDVRWRVDEDTALRADHPCYASVNDARADTYSLEEYGSPSAAGDECGIAFLMPSYMPSSSYSVASIEMFDVAENMTRVRFTGADGDEASPAVDLVTANPDTEPPDIDINRIRVSAEPTNPEAPNGETLVTIAFPHRDNISGLAVSELLLRDPQGGTHHHWIYPDDREELYPSRNPVRWQTLERVVILPPGSIPGTWGLAEIVARDRARNVERYNFVEIVRFDVEG